MDGLRTLAFAQKVLTQAECDTFMTRLRKAEAKLKNREQAILAVQARIEMNMEFLGVTGVEDKL
jgi:magnesium-transporting ATPase (P-type)